MNIPGYAGIILDIDLSRNKIERKALTKELIHGYLGGRGFSSRLVYINVKPKIPPFSPDNVLAIAPGALVGTPTWSANRYSVCAKSPLGIFGWSSSGGHWAPELKLAGYDAIIIRGKAKNPVYLWISNDQVEIKNAKNLWGKNAIEAAELIKEELKEKTIETITIGQAGENLVNYASIITVGRIRRAAGRSGMGAIMGSKNLKAIAVKGEKSIEIANPEALEKTLDEILKILEADSHSQSTPKFGSWFLVDALASNGALVTRNGQQGNFELENNLKSSSFLAILERATACFLCPLRCGRLVKIDKGPYAGYIGKGPEFESIGMLGPNIGIGDKEFLVIASDICDRYGLDTISTGSVIAFAMECYEKGILTKEDLGGLKLEWGSIEATLKLIEMIAKREGFGNILAEGVKKASEIIGKGSEKYAMHVKGLEISAQDGRAQKSMAIAHAASVRGADHLRHCTFYDEVGFEDAIAEKFGKQYLPEMADRLAVKYKGFMAKETEDFAIMVDSLPLCVSGGSYWPPVLWWKDIAKIYQATTGIKTTEKDLRIVAERVVNLKRAYNIRLCLDRRHDTLPARFLEEPAPDGPCKGQTVDLKTLLDDYYKHRGWDIETGLIPESKLKELGLDHVAEELRKIGKLPKTKS